MRWGNSRCAKCTYSAPVTVDLRAIARALAPVERYPLETTSADVCLPGPTVEAKRDVRSASTGMTRVECPTCGGQAWQEPPLLVNGVERVVVRCRACRSAPRMCPACGVRPQRKWGRRWASYCSECWKQRASVEATSASVEAMKEEELPDMATVATNGKATIACPYCKKSFTPIRSTQVTCGATACQKKHACHLSKHPKYKQGVAKPVPVSVVPPVACQSTPMETPPPVPALVPVNHDAITAAVDALAAIPADKRAGVLAVVEAREKAAAMLAELRS